jgi:hypothetical protein
MIWYKKYPATSYQDKVIKVEAVDEKYILHVEAVEASPQTFLIFTFYIDTLGGGLHRLHM